MKEKHKNRKKFRKEKVAYKTGQSNVTFKVNVRDSQNHDTNAN